MNEEKVRHLISYFRRMMEQMIAFLDDVEKELDRPNKDKRTNTGAWP